MGVRLKNVDEIVTSNGQTLDVTAAVASASSGGGNTVELTAKGTISAGDGVMVNLDGTASVLSDNVDSVYAQLGASSYPDFTSWNTSQPLQHLIYEPTTATYLLLRRDIINPFRMNNGEIQWLPEIDFNFMGVSSSYLNQSYCAFVPYKNSEIAVFYRGASHYPYMCKFRVNPSGSIGSVMGPTVLKSNSCYYIFNSELANQTIYHAATDRIWSPSRYGSNAIRTFSWKMDGTGEINKLLDGTSTTWNSTYSALVHYESEDIIVHIYADSNDDMRIDYFDPNDQSSGNYAMSGGDWSNSQLLEVGRNEVSTAYKRWQNMKAFYDSTNDCIVVAYEGHSNAKDEFAGPMVRTIKWDNGSFVVSDPFRFGNFKVMNRSQLGYDPSSDSYVMAGKALNENKNYNNYWNTAVSLQLSSGKFKVTGVRDYYANLELSKPYLINIQETSEMHIVSRFSGQGYYHHLRLNLEDMNEPTTRFIGIADNSASSGDAVKVNLIGNLAPNKYSILPSNAVFVNAEGEIGPIYRSDKRIGVSISNNEIMLGG